MVIRDDRGGIVRMHGNDNPKFPLLGDVANPDRVLIDCPTCARSHFVTVDACPDAATAAAETAMVDGVKRAA